MGIVCASAASLVFSAAKRSAHGQTGYGAVPECACVDHVGQTMVAGRSLTAVTTTAQRSALAHLTELPKCADPADPVQVTALLPLFLDALAADHSLPAERRLDDRVVLAYEGNPVAARLDEIPLPDGTPPVADGH